MKKSICILLSIISILGIFVGCDQAQPINSTTQATPTTTTTQAVTNTTANTQQSSTTVSSEQPTTVDNNQTTNDSTSSTTAINPTTTTTKKTTTTTASNPYSYPFETKKSMVVRIVSWRSDTVVECIVLQHVSQNSSLAAVGETVYVEFDKNTTIYAPDADKLPVKRLPTKTDFPANQTDIIVTVDNNQSFFPKSLHVKKVSVAERLALMMKYKANNPNLKTTTYKIDLSGYSGTLSYATDNDKVYITYEKSTRYVAVDINTGKKLHDVALPSKPAKIRVYGNEVWISYPELKMIGVYDKSTFEMKREIMLDSAVGSFDAYDKYIVYATNDGHAYVYRYNMQTNQSVQVGDKTFRVYKPDILINKDKNVFYINESGSTETSILCYDLLSLERLSVKVSASSGASTTYKITNKIKTTFLVDGALYWTILKLDPVKVHTVLSEIKLKNKTGSIALYNVDKNYICTDYGIYDTKTSTMLADFKENYISFALSTASGNLVMLDDYVLNIVKK